jgi:hypothetical protein
VVTDDEESLSAVGVVVVVVVAESGRDGGTSSAPRVEGMSRLSCFTVDSDIVDVDSDVTEGVGSCCCCCN